MQVIAVYKIFLINLFIIIKWGSNLILGFLNIGDYWGAFFLSFFLFILFIFFNFNFKERLLGPGLICLFGKNGAFRLGEPEFFLFYVLIVSFSWVVWGGRNHLDAVFIYWCFLMFSLILPTEFSTQLRKWFAIFLFLTPKVKFVLFGVLFYFAFNTWHILYLIRLC